MRSKLESLLKNNINSMEIKIYFQKVAQLALYLYDLRSRLNSEYFNTTSIEELQSLNMDLYKEVMPENYEISYGNPTYCVEKLGDKIGQVLSAIYVSIRRNIREVFKGNTNDLDLSCELLVNAYECLDKGLDCNELKETIRKTQLQNQSKDLRGNAFKYQRNESSFYVDIILNSDLNDLRYLYKSGLYVSENEIKTANFFNNYPEEKTEELAKTTVTAYVNGFKKDNKDITLRENVSIIYSLGQELLVRYILKELKAQGLNGIINLVETSEYNKQYGYDHRFDNSLYINEDFIKDSNGLIKEVAEEIKVDLTNYSGILVVEKFGETPFSPVGKKECLKLSEEQNKLVMSHRNFATQLADKYMPDKETSFCIIAFPSPEIGEDFESIFEDTCKINMLDSSKYEVIQQKIIDALDNGEFVHVKGKGRNKTDIMVKMHEIKNPEKETNFVNCVADVNVPVGEVFTSPVLKGTTGTLHLEETYLDLKYYNLTLNFEDGYIKEYSCTNFENEDENKKYIEENLLFPHKTLPLGEFAIGTNTLAYVISEKYGIIDKLPVLIIEKMGPHFAIGDTCFSFGEDNPVYNQLDKKEIIARDNEKSILRKTNIEEAYTNVHTDITLPYDGLEFITVICKNGEKIDIIRDGRFVLEGTEELNEAFEK